MNIDMIDYTNSMVDNFPIKLKPNNISLDPETGDCFAIVESEETSKCKYQEIHTIVAK